MSTSVLTPVVRVKLTTTLGAIVLKLDAEKAPATVQNFVSYVNDGHYHGTLFHRVINDFMVQGGGYDSDMMLKPVRAPIANEADNGLKNRKGTISMARTDDPHSATSQFFINVADNAFLDFRVRGGSGWGYCVFGEVVEGMDVVDKMRVVKTHSKSYHSDVPETPIVIESAEVLAD